MISPPHIPHTLWCPPRLSSRPSALCHVYNPAQYSCFVSFFKSPPIRRWKTTFPLLSSIRFPLQYQSLTKCSTTDLFLDDSQSSHSHVSTLLKPNFFLLDLKQQLSKIQDCSLTTTHSARNLGFIFDEYLTFSDQITALSKSCYYHIHERRCIRPYIDFKTAAPLPLP